MTVVTATIEGTTPILLNSPYNMGGRATVGKKVIPTPEVEAAGKRYLLPGTNMLAFPVLNIKASMLYASGGLKVGKKMIKPYVAGCVTPAEEFASFGTEKYLIDTRRVVVQRQGVMRSRPRLDKWKLTFDFEVDDVNLPDGFEAADLKGILEEAGTRIGIGDFRPTKGAYFGRFKVTAFKVK